MSEGGESVEAHRSRMCCPFAKVAPSTCEPVMRDEIGSPGLGRSVPPATNSRGSCRLRTDRYAECQPLSHNESSQASTPASLCQSDGPFVTAFGSSCSSAFRLFSKVVCV